MQLSGAIDDYACSLARDCDIDSTIAFISDKTTPETRLFYLGNYGVDQEVLDRYRSHRICDADPFVDVQMNEAEADEGGFRLSDQPEVRKCGARAQDYWRFVSHQEIEVVGASTLRLQSRLYLVIGAHRSQRRRGRPGVPTERLGHHIERLQTKIATSLLSSMLGGGGGYRSLLAVVAPQPKRGDRPELSARETEIARLVCEGCQNKEIAWLAHLSEYTVENHLRRIYQKLGIHNRAALVARMSAAG